MKSVTLQEMKPVGRVRYDGVAMALHWAIALLIIGLLALGWYMGDLPKGPARDWLFNLHTSFGTLTLLLVGVRILWRAGHRPPALAGIVPAWQHLASRVTHGLLYLMMAVMPLSGFIASNFGKGIIFFGMPLPRLGWPDRGISHFFNEIHETSAILLVSLIGLHVLAALWHHFVQKDRVLRRMLPGQSV